MALCTLLLGLGTLCWRSGNPVIVGNESTIQVVERTVGLQWLGDDWYVVPTGDWTIALPLIHHVHRMNRPRGTVTLRTKAQTQSGLEVQIRSLSVRYEVPQNGAVELIRRIGTQQSQLEEFIGSASVVAIRTLLSNTPDATTGVPIDQDALEARLSRLLSDTLAEAGIQVQDVHLGGLRYEPETDQLIGRLRAARHRDKLARQSQRQEDSRHVSTIRDIEEAGHNRTEEIKREFDPLISEARNHGARQMVDADLEFQRRRRAVDIRQKTLRVRSEAWAYQARKKAEALTLRVKASANLTPEFMLHEVGQVVYGGLEHMDSAQCLPAGQKESGTAGHVP